MAATLSVPAVDLDAMTKVQLLEYAAGIGLEGLGSRNTKAEIMEAIREAVDNG